MLHFSQGETGNGGHLPHSITISFTVLIFLTVKSENNSESFVTSCFNIRSVTKAFKQAVD